jgi:hypothetical protein
METVAGIFVSRAEAERAVQQLRSMGTAENRIALLIPGTSKGRVPASVATTETEQPGMGQALGGTVGGAIGVAGGASLGAAAASLLVPGVGPVIAGGLLGAAILGAGGTVAGMEVGEALEEGMADGLPHDELFVYEDALRKGHSVVIAFAEDDQLAERTRQMFAQAGAESIDAAREDWWLGLRDAEEEHYRERGGDFRHHEVGYRRGFEAALHPNLRGKSFDEAAPELKNSFRAVASDEAFRQGYERGQAYQRGLQEKLKS